MTAIELGFFVLCAVLASVGWVVGSHRWVEWYYRMMAAMVGGFIPVALLILVSRSTATRLKKRPPYPMCENGTCKWDDYHATKAIGSDVEFTCKCGKRYVMSGRHFYRLGDDGQRQAYKVLNARHQWEDEM